MNVRDIDGYRSLVKTGIVADLARPEPVLLTPGRRYLRRRGPRVRSLM